MARSDSRKTLARIRARFGCNVSRQPVAESGAGRGLGLEFVALGDSDGVGGEHVGLRIALELVDVER